jgi:hypothetical protein
MPRRWNRPIGSGAPAWPKRLQRQTAASAAAAASPAALVLAPVSGALEEAVREATHLREALDRTEEQLWEAKGQMLLDRERLTSLELQLAASKAETKAGTMGASPAAEPTISEAAHHAILGAVLEELAEIELGVRLEIGKLDSLEHVIANWRSDPPVTDPEADIRPPPAD